MQLRGGILEHCGRTTSTPRKTRVDTATRWRRISDVQEAEFACWYHSLQSSLRVSLLIPHAIAVTSGQRCPRLSPRSSRLLTRRFSHLSLSFVPTSSRSAPAAGQRVGQIYLRRRARPLAVHDARARHGSRRGCGRGVFGRLATKRADPGRGGEKKSARGVHGAGELGLLAVRGQRCWPWTTLLLFEP